LYEKEAEFDGLQVSGVNGATSEKESPLKTIQITDICEKKESAERSK